MGEQAPERDAAVTTVTFANSKTARLARAAGRGYPPDLLAQLGLRAPRPTLWVVGGADNLDRAVRPGLQRMFDDAAAPVVAEVGGVLVDGGTQSGVMEILGRAVAGQHEPLDLLGVAPAGTVTYPDGPPAPAGAAPLDPNHTHFVLAAADDWGGETRLMFDLVAELSRGMPAAVLVAGGGKIVPDEVLRAVRSALPVVVLRGTGGFADELADAAALAAAHASRPAPPADPVLREIVTRGEIHAVPLDGDPAMLHQLLVGLLAEEPLRMAWQEFARLDQGAKRSQTRFKQQQTFVLGLGVTATALAVIQATLEQDNALNRWDWLADPLRYAIVVVPILIASLVAAAGRLQFGTRYVLLRGSAEAIKREIYRYRTRTGVYADQQAHEKPAGQKLVETVGSTLSTLMRTDVSQSAVPEYHGPLPPPYGAAESDHGFSRLSPHEYVTVRVDDQLTYYEKTTARHERLLRWLRLLIIGSGAVGTFLAAIQLELWIALTTSLAGAFTAYLEARQVRTSLVLYNQAAADLKTIRGWWKSLPAEAQAVQDNIDNLVRSAERILKAEMTGWVQEMQDALVQLRQDEVTVGEARRRDQEAAQAAADAQLRPPSTGTTGDGAGEPVAPDQGEARVGTRRARRRAADAEEGRPAGADPDGH
jgi:SLOG in TRPM, prokaryote/SMODS and SLOG-associating 2TM effector domain 1/Protein of unknown function (DUF4231)